MAKKAGGLGSEPLELFLASSDEKASPQFNSEAPAERFWILSLVVTFITGTGSHSLSILYFHRHVQKYI